MAVDIASANANAAVHAADHGARSSQTMASTWISARKQTSRSRIPPMRIRGSQ